MNSNKFSKMIRFLFNNNTDVPFKLSKLEDERFQDFYSCSSNYALSDVLYIVKNTLGASTLNYSIDDFGKGYIIEALVNFAESIDLSKIDIPMSEDIYKEVVKLFGDSVSELLSETSRFNLQTAI